MREKINLFFHTLSRETFFVFSFSYARICTWQNSTLEKGKNRSNGASGKWGKTHKKNAVENCRKTPIDRGQVCVEQKNTCVKTQVFVFKNMGLPTDGALRIRGLF